MPQQEHHRRDDRLYSRGANTDISAPLLPDGYYRDAVNMRPSSVDGETGSLEKIGGYEVFLPAAEPSQVGYRCIGSILVKGKLIAFWATDTPGYPPFMAIDGLTMLKSDLLGWLPQFPFQLDKNENCDGGEVFVTDNNTVPMIFNIQDIIDAYTAGEQTYFANFNPSLYQINRNAPADHPVFTGLVTLGQGGGLTIGQKAWSIRYSNAAGDKTNWTESTPQAYVPGNQGSVDDSLYQVFPGIRTYGANSDLQVQTTYGARIVFRVNNPAGYDYIEVKRTEWSAGLGLQDPGVSYIVGRINISPGEFSIREFVDPGDSNVLEEIPADEDQRQAFFIERARSVRYVDNRWVVMNFETGSRDLSGVSFRQESGESLVPVTKDLGIVGYSDPVSFAYDKRFMAGERYGIGIQFYDGSLNKPFALPIPGYENYQFPNRREEKSGGSLVYSDSPLYAANTDHVVSPTFEAIEQGSTKRERFTDILNISPYTTLTQADLNAPPANGAPPPDPSFSSSSFTLTSGGFQLSNYFNPFHPYGNQDPQDGNIYAHYYGAFNQRIDGAPVSGGYSESYGYQPDGFAPKYQSLGAAIYGVEDIPEWAQAFSVVRTKPAGRVVAQGIAMYSMYESGGAIGTDDGKANKKTGAVWFYSSDVEAGVVDESIWDDFLQNPSSYRLQFVSPLGFYTEPFAWKDGGTVNFGLQRRADNVDMISYARVMSDDGSIIPCDNVAHGTQPPVGVPGSNYTDWAKWRSSTVGSNSPFHNPSFGNAQVEIQPLSVIPRQENFGPRFYEIFTGDEIYSLTGTYSDSAASDPYVRLFHEPWYMVNIIKQGAETDNDDPVEYISTGTYVKLSSKIGLSSGSGDQTYQLVDERPEDCCGWLTSDYRYIYITTPTGVEQRYVCLNTMSGQISDAGSQVTTILADINANGFWTAPDGDPVHGVYAVERPPGQLWQVFISGNFYIPAQGSSITVRYDSTAPVRAFGGDATVGPSVFCPIDRANGSGFKMYGTAMPLNGYVLNSRYALLRDISPGSATVETNRTPNYLSTIRQWLIMYDAESRFPVNLFTSSGDASFSQGTTFPTVSYVMRPMGYPGSQVGNAQAQGLFGLYDTYFPDEYTRWDHGGFRYRAGSYPNLDYAVQPQPSSFTTPSEYEEKTKFCNGIIWGLPKPIMATDQSASRTFLASNLYAIDDGSGSIKRAWSANSGSGFNLYAITENGVCLLLTNKNILTGAAGEQVATQVVDNFIGQEQWLSRQIGMPFEYWRWASEGHAPYGQGMADSLFWVNGRSAYRLTNNSITDIAANLYTKRIRKFVADTESGALVWRTSAYNTRHDEAWFCSVYESPGRDRVTEVLVYSAKMGAWVGAYTYGFDSYICRGQDIYGMQGCATYQLDTGLLMGASPVACSVDQVTAREPSRRKEFWKFNFVSDQKPTLIEFFDKDGVKTHQQDEAKNGPLWVKLIDGWEQMIDRTDQSYSPTRNRFQDVRGSFRVHNNAEEEFVLHSSTIFYKLIK